MLVQSAPLMTNLKWCNKVHFGDCLDVMTELPSDSIDLIVTSPPYTDARKQTYGGISPDEYVDWFCERSTSIFTHLHFYRNFRI